MLICLKSDDIRSTYRAFFRFGRCVIGYIDFLFPQGGMPERENYEHIKRKKVFNHRQRKS